MDALERGAAGFILKDLSSTMIVKALELVLSGERYIPSVLVEGGNLFEKIPVTVEKSHVTTVACLGS